MKVLLIHAKCPYEEISHKQIPLGIMYIAAFIETKHEVRIYDEPVETRSLKEVIVDFKPQVIGVSFTTQSSLRAYEIAREYKNTAILVAGGIHATLHPNEALHNGFEIVSYGEGEMTFPYLLENIQDRSCYINIPGIYYLENDELVKTNRCINNICLDNYPMPARHLLDMGRYDQGSIITSRGCPFKCKFCVSSVFREQNYRHRSAEKVFREIEQVVVIYNKSDIHFCDDTFTINHKFVKDLCKLIIKSNLKFNWSILSRIDTINDDTEMLILLKEAGCQLIIFGIETGSEQILQRISKGISVSQIEKTLLLCKNIGLDIKTTWIVGLPGNYDEQMESLDLMKKTMPNQITIHMFVPYPGTELYINREKYGISINEKTFMQVLPYLNPGFLDERIFRTPSFKLNYLSFGEMKDIALQMSKELIKLGYIYPNEYDGNGEERTFKTFLDKIGNPLLKRK